MKIRNSEQLKTVLALYDQDTEQKEIVPGHQRCKNHGEEILGSENEIENDGKKISGSEDESSQF